MNALITNVLLKLAKWMVEILSHYAVNKYAELKGEFAMAEKAAREAKTIVDLSSQYYEAMEALENAPEDKRLALEIVVNRLKKEIRDEGIKSNTGFFSL